MVQTDQELASVLQTRVGQEEKGGESNAARRRKMSRMEAVRHVEQNQKPQILGVRSFIMYIYILSVCTLIKE